MIAGDYGAGYNLSGNNNDPSLENKVNELTIIGNTGNPEDVIFWGNNNQQIFQLNDMRVTFRNVSFVNGSIGDGDGGAIATNYGRLSIDNCIFENNKAQGQYGTGGAIYTYMTDLIINNSIFNGGGNDMAIRQSRYRFFPFSHDRLDQCCTFWPGAKHLFKRLEITIVLVT